MDSKTSSKSAVAPATEIDTSGAPQQIVPDVDMSHPAVDNDPRANTTADQNRIDFNDPTISGADQVAINLGLKTEAEARDEAQADAKKG
ncbi:hypothetical protein DRN02_007700 [Sphingomonas paucimobilis]|uniref:hypothetical protein n=1 Tax=Sphingomonas paucimobilis TaxID=13689 RepID=UPI000DE24639|nr:hypothetical protein [Sphingomonas paucimobilis]QBE91911.1 hypothetical protein DRN02_007700 [Sphingomonas paucimobilis]